MRWNHESSHSLKHLNSTVHDEIMFSPQFYQTFYLGFRQLSKKKYLILQWELCSEWDVSSGFVLEQQKRFKLEVTSGCVLLTVAEVSAVDELSHISCSHWETEEMEEDSELPERTLNPNNLCQQLSSDLKNKFQVYLHTFIHTSPKIRKYPVLCFMPIPFLKPWAGILL